MRQIVKHYKTLKQAERYNTYLQNKYNYARLVRWPIHSESGEYVWEVSVD